ncbi:putative endonuclease [Novosphingobium sp. Rr 2-17]|uniref:YraN family protein n=1 Tax=Novosphingobium sp. Rr 2-17 TaxID=555793 RepID=UPI0002698858|nr:YraN family protein [Novosphingobium sp. Rr 2-17]EIZ80023.1 putative endonuclease [Novosphingobium sp. Rr 2-17]
MTAPRLKDPRLKAEREGRRGERAAAWYLWLTGWRVLDRRVKTQRGEIDLIARKGRTLCFVEVKWRRTSKGLDTAIDAYRLRRVADAAVALAARYAKAGDDVRIDVLLMTPGRWPRRIVNAWQPDA